MVPLPVDVVSRVAVSRILIPYNQRVPFARFYIICAVASATEVDEGAATFMPVRQVKLPVARLPRVAAYCERGAGKLSAEANIERHVRVVRVHVKAEILVGAVLDHE